MEPKEEDYFVGIYDPLDVRRNLLESSKEIIKSLQAFDKVESVREEKLKLFKEMRRVMAELDLLVSKLKTKLPKSYLRKAVEKNNVSSLRKIQYPANKKFSSELERLEQELRNVERELSSMK